MYNTTAGGGGFVVQYEGTAKEWVGRGASGEKREEEKTIRRCFSSGPFFHLPLQESYNVDSKNCGLPFLHLLVLL